MEKTITFTIEQVTEYAKFVAQNGISQRQQFQRYLSLPKVQNLPDFYNI